MRSIDGMKEVLLDDQPHGCAVRVDPMHAANRLADVMDIVVCNPGSPMMGISSEMGIDGSEIIELPSHRMDFIILDQVIVSYKLMAAWGRL
jgi:hypothetical protein